MKNRLFFWVLPLLLVFWLGSGIEVMGTILGNSSIIVYYPANKLGKIIK